MQKVASGLVPVVAIDRSRKKPLQEQIYDAYRTAILAGNLNPGERVPSSRELALELGLSRTTVLSAYAQLEAEEHLITRKGAGTFVSKPAFAESAVQKNQKHTQPRSTAGSRTISARASAPKSLPSFPWLFGQGAFAVGQVALEVFPFPIWSRLIARYSREAGVKSLHFSDPMGSLALRRALASYLRTVRAVNCVPEQLMIVSGSQQALDLTARVLFNPEDRVWVEEPGYPSARDVLLAAGCNLVAVPVDEEGLDVSAGVNAFRHAKGALVSPSHQPPLGSIMSIPRRQQLLEWAEREGAWIIEDDYDSEYRHGAMPVPSLQGMDANARVIYVGTFSKTLFPSLRVGYLVIPKDLIDRFAAFRHAMDRFPPRLYQDVLTEFIEAGHYARHIRRTKRLYQQRRTLLVECIKDLCGSDLEILGAEAGLFLSVSMTQRLSDHQIAARAAEQKLWLCPLSWTYFGVPKAQGFILGFGNVAKSDIRPAVERLARLLAPKQ